MSHTYDVFVNESGDPLKSGVRVRVTAESEHEAMRLAIHKSAVRNGQVASIKRVD